MMSLKNVKDSKKKKETSEKKEEEEKKIYASWNKESLFQEKGECEEMCMTFLSILTLDNIFVNVVCYMWSVTIQVRGQRQTEEDWLCRV